MDPAEEITRRLLEKELRLLDPRDLRSHTWYHGSTLRGGRKGAELELVNEGDFLVRDCASQPGNYVLSVRCKSQVLHFVIKKGIIQPDTVYERTQYQFEGEAFDTVADLITFHVGSGKPISQASGARIITPKPRAVPITYSVSNQGQQHVISCSSSSSSIGSPPRLPKKQQRSHSLTPQHLAEHQNNNNNNNFCTNQSSTLPRVLPQPLQNQAASCSLSLGRHKMTRVTSDPTLLMLQQPNNQQQVTAAPPKPPRINHPYHQVGYQASGSDSGNGSGDSEFEASNSDFSGHQIASPVAASMTTAPTVAMKGVVIHRFNAIAGATANEDAIENEYELSTEEQLILAAPSIEIESAFDLEAFATILLPAGDHLPLDPTALRGVSGMLLDSAPRVLASHLTRIDLQMVLTPAPSAPGLTGLELAILPHGKQARIDLIERSECLKLLVAVTVLAGASALERATTISKWIRVATDTKTALGNLYGFCAVMLGLCLPQIQRLSNTWHLLRQKHTDEAFNFEAKLRPTLRAMNESANPQAPNTSLPHLLPIVLLGERCSEDVLGSIACSSLTSAILSPWENSAEDCGLSIVWSHLQDSRKLADNISLFRRNAEIALEGCRNDELLSDAFRTEFHIKFLWGSKGTNIAPEERHLKFTRVLDAMYEKCVTTEIST